MIRCVVFDFDGTIRQSVSIKHDAYFVAVRGIERGDEMFRDIIRDFPTMTSFSGCALFVKRARTLGIDTPSGEELAERYSRACEDAIAACAEVPGAGAFFRLAEAPRNRFFRGIRNAPSTASRDGSADRS